MEEVTLRRKLGQQNDLWPSNTPSDTRIKIVHLSRCVIVTWEE